jgi:hypothetical protein
MECTIKVVPFVITHEQRKIRPNKSIEWPGWRVTMTGNYFADEKVLHVGPLKPRAKLRIERAVAILASQNVKVIWDTSNMDCNQAASGRSDQGDSDWYDSLFQPSYTECLLRSHRERLISNREIEKARTPEEQARRVVG